MKILRSSPDHPQVMEIYGGLLKLSFIAIVFCQLVSALTEAGAVFTFFESKLIFLGYWGFIPTWIGTGVFVALLEFGGILVLAYSIDAVLYDRFKGTLESVLSIVVFLLTITLYTTSVNVSMKGKENVVRRLETPPTLLSTIQIDSAYSIGKSTIKKTFSNDSLFIASNYDQQIKAINSRYNADIAKINTSIANYQRKQQRTGKSYVSSINYLKGKIEGLQSEKAAKIGEKESAKGVELKQLIDERKADFAATTATYEKEKKTITNKNNNKQHTFEASIKTNSNNLGNLIFITIPILFLSVLVRQIIYKKAGVKTSYHVDDYFFRPSILSAYSNYMSELVNEKAHTKIHQWHSKVNEVQLNDRPIVIFDRVSNTQYIKTQKEEIEDVELIALNSNVNYDKSRYSLKSAYAAQQQLSNDSLSNAQSFEKKAIEMMNEAKGLREQGETEKADEIEVKAKQVIKAFFETDFTPPYSKKLGKKFKQKLGNYLDGIGGNPFDDFLPKKRRKIGFNFGGNENAESYGGTEQTLDESSANFESNHYHFHGDKYTVPHRQKNNKIIQVSMKDILGKINLYSSRVNETYSKLEKYTKANNQKEVDRQIKALENRESTLKYWNNKKEELLKNQHNQY